MELPERGPSPSRTSWLVHGEGEKEAGETNTMSSGRHGKGEMLIHLFKAISLEHMDSILCQMSEIRETKMNEN